MHLIDWLIMLVPFALVMWLALYARKYARDAVDFLAAGRVAGRYVICVGDVAAALSVITLVANCEATYKAGSAMGFWTILTLPLGMILSLTGYCTYRWRASKALSFGQFVELRYSRTLRIFCAVLRNVAEMVTNAIGPAIAANFFIYFLGLPHRVHIFGVNLPCFAILVAISLVLATIAIWPAGRISLLITDTAQALLSFPIFVIVAGYIFFNFNWGTRMEPVLMNRVPGESFLNPFDIAKLRDFNMFALGVTIMAEILQRASWFGNDTTNSGRTPHEQKMAGVLGTWRGGFAFTMIGLTALLVITVMNHEAFLFPGAHGKFSSRETRIVLLNKIADEAVPDAAVRADIAAALEAVPPALMDEPLSQLRNNDTPYIDAARSVLNGNIPPELRDEAEAVRRGERTPSPELAAIQGENAKQAQKVRTLYGQMMLPVTLRQILPTGVIGLFALLMLMLLVSTDDSRIFNASSTWVQDVILPFLKKAPTSKAHIAMLRWSSVSVAVFFFVVAVFFSQLDYINMFTQIMCAIWLGGGGTVMVFGLYSRFGNVVGAWCSLVFGSGFSLAGLVLQRTWAAHVVPVLDARGVTEGVFRFFARLASPLNPWVDWSFGFNSGESSLEQAVQLFREKFFMNSTEIYGISMVLSIVAYCIGSYIALKAGWCRLFDLDRLLHRGRYADAADAANDGALRANDDGALRQMTNVDNSVIAANGGPSLPPKAARHSSILRFVSRIAGIDDEYTLGDKIIAWSVFAYSVCWQFGFAFVGVFLWNAASPWPKAWWGRYYYITSLIIPMIVGGISTVWFIWGGIRDGIRLFHDLDARVADADDNGMVKREP